jgi:hypothetical protein
MKYKEKPISDDEIRVIGGETRHVSGKRKPLAFILCLVAVLLIIAGIVVWLTSRPGPVEPNEPEPGYYDPTTLPVEQPAVKMPLAKEDDLKAYIEMADTTINDIPMRLYLPHKVSCSLHLGTIDRTDCGIIFAAQATDIRADNGGIVGAYVLKGEPKAWGLSKTGYCAIINDTVTVGVADNSPLFEEATEKGGYFFRQFPLVGDGRLVENEQRGKSVRRALCVRAGELFTVETLTPESFHDFSQALVDLGVDQAIYLVGGNAYGWALDAQGQRHEFGDPSPKNKYKWRNINYLVMRERE